MGEPSKDRKYYVTRTVKDHSGAFVPDIDIGKWSCRYLNDAHEYALVRDPDGIKDYPMLGVDVSLKDALDSLPIQLPLNTTQEEADDITGSLGLNRIVVDHVQKDRIRGR